MRIINLPHRAVEKVKGTEEQVNGELKSFTQTLNAGLSMY